MNSVLVSVPTERVARPLVEAAMSVAKSFDARLDAIAVGFETTSIGLAVEGGTAVAAIFEIERERALARAQAALSVVKAEAQISGVVSTCMPSTATPGDAVGVVGALARLYDLTMVLQPNADDETFDNSLPEQILLEAGGPVLFVPYTHRGPLKIANVGIAWDGSRVAARAVRDALPLLSKARKITLISANDVSPPEVSADALKVHLGWRGLHADVIRTTAAPIDIQPTLLSIAADECLDLMIMGAYGHSRLKERILGGVSRSMLQSMTLPTMMSH